MNEMTAAADTSRQNILVRLSRLLSTKPHIEFSVLVGSRAEGNAHDDSDWDIAMQWKYGADWMTLLGQMETLRREIAEVIGVMPDKIDLIDLRRANLAMRASVAECGLPLTGQDTLAWAHFLNRTWRELEDFYWEKNHAA